MGPRKCECKDWKENIDLLNAPNTIMFARNPDLYKGYQGKRFLYCPWCSELLVEIKDD